MMLIALGVLLIAAALHPFTTYPLSLAVWKRLRPARSEPSPATTPSISILCCARNEESVIVAKARNCLEMAANYPGRAEILFYLDACADGTAAALQPFADRITLVEGHEPAGKSVGMGRLVDRSSGEILVFTDANTTVAPDALGAFAEHFRDPKVGCVCSYLTITNGTESETAEVNGAYWRLEEAIRLLESSTGSSMTADGALFSVRRSLYTHTPADIIDDMHTSMNVLLSGARVVASRTVIAQERTAPGRAVEFARKKRIACRAFNCYRLLAPRLHRAGPEVVYKFYSHKVLRWLSLALAGPGLALLLAGVVAQGDWRWAVAISSAVAGAMCLGAAGFRPFSQIWEAFLAHLAVTLGVVQSLRGERYQVWTPFASGRPAPATYGSGLAPGIGGAQSYARQGDAFTQGPLNRR
jgi:cellulose synthase/poly-beta-1,6-N-acetylglucosamine synthase-like glycosyltransferase